MTTTTNTETAMKTLTILGPNLPDQTNGSMHVHAAGCADIKRRYGSGVQQFTDDFASAQEVAEAVYADMIAINGEPSPNGDTDDWTSVIGEFHFLPCCGDLPTETPADGSSAECDDCRNDRPCVTHDTPASLPAGIVEAVETARRMVATTRDRLESLEADMVRNAKQIAKSALEAVAQIEDPEVGMTRTNWLDQPVSRWTEQLAQHAQLTEQARYLEVIVEKLGGGE